MTAPALMSALSIDESADQQAPAMAAFTPAYDSPPLAVASPMPFQELARSFGSASPGTGGVNEQEDARRRRRPSAGRKTDFEPRVPSTTAEVRVAENPAGALATVTSSIQRELEAGDTLVVWLVDASISLENDRRLMAQHMESFYRSIGAFDVNDRRDGSRLMNAIVAFGAGAEQILEPREFGIRVCSKLTEIPVDATGLENVMTTVRTAVQRYRGPRRRDRMMIVIITDESGDDVDQLEPTIQFCRDYSVPVHVIGPSAVFGAERGSHAWTEPATGDTYLLPVKRGPDTALPERAWLPYWHESDLPPWRNQGVVSASGTEWYGGAYRERLVTCFGPYPLTRLALETGGSFTMLDREADRSHYRLDDMREYMPEYTSVEDYRHTLAERPLRALLASVAEMTMQPQVAETLLPPPMVFINGRQYYYPFKSVPQYIPPGDFPQQFRAELVKERQVTTARIRLVKELLAPFDARSEEWEAEYRKEPSRRCAPPST